MKSSHAAVKLSRWGSVHSAPDKSPSPNREQHNKSHFYRRFYAARSSYRRGMAIVAVMSFKTSQQRGDCRAEDYGDSFVQPRN